MKTIKMPIYASGFSPCCDARLWKPPGSPASSPWFCKGCGTTYPADTAKESK